MSLILVASLALPVMGAKNISDRVHGAPSIVRTDPPPQTTDLLATPHQPTVDDVQLEWSESVGATSYNVYRSMSVDGTGFNFTTPNATVPATGTGHVLWVDTGAYADDNNYAWAVVPVSGGGENLNITDIAWKLCYPIFVGIGPMGRDLNYISLPYRMNITSGSYSNDAAALALDMRNYGTPQNAFSSVNRWDQDASVWESRNAFAGTNFPLTPGEGYMVVARSNFTYKIVGSYDPDFYHTLKVGTGSICPADNYMALPYHMYIEYSPPNSARGLLSNIRTYGTPTNGVTSVNKWNQDLSYWMAIAPFGGINYPLIQGESYRVVVTQSSISWQCPVVTLGA